MSVLKAFNDHFVEFLNDILRIFPENHDIRTARTSIETLRKVNPRKILLIWKEYIGIPYRAPIENGEISFFISKAYDNDVKDTPNTGAILDAIERMRQPVRDMGDENQAKAMKYIQNLTKLSFMYSR